MKKVLKFGSIGCIGVGLILVLVIFFFFSRSFSGLHILGDAKGFKAFINEMFYPTGFMIVMVLVEFAGISSCIFVFSDELNGFIAGLQLAAGSILFVWMLLLVTAGKAQNKKKKTEITAKYERYSKNYNTAKENYDAKLQVLDDLSGTTDVKEYINMFLLCSDYEPKVTNGTLTEGEAYDYYMANKDTYTEHKSDYTAYVAAKTKLNQQEVLFNAVKNKYDRYTKLDNSVIPLFIISLIPAIGTGAEFALYILNRKGEDFE